jgi:formiminotetrahydrofolate cyclodeaminase
VTFADQTISDFLEHVASTTTTPSGGAVAAIGGAAGAALCEMVCIHTIGKDGYANVEQDLTKIRDELNIHRTRLLELADEDSAAVDGLQAAFEITDDKERDEIIQNAAKRAIKVPLETAEECLKIMEHATVVTEEGNQNAIADAGAGVFLAHAALQASVWTVQFNLEMIENTSFIAKMENHSTEIDDSADEVLEQVKVNVSNAV